MVILCRWEGFTNYFLYFHGTKDIKRQAVRSNDSVENGLVTVDDHFGVILNESKIYFTSYQPYTIANSPCIFKYHKMIQLWISIIL